MRCGVFLLFFAEMRRFACQLGRLLMKSRLARSRVPRYVGAMGKPCSSRISCKETLLSELVQRVRSMRPRARARAACAPASRAQRQGRPEAAPHAWRPAGLGGAPVDGGLVSLGCEEVGDDVDRGVDRIARVLVCRGASIVMCALGGWCACGVECGGAVVLISRGGWARRAGLGRRSHLKLKRR